MSISGASKRRSMSSSSMGTVRPARQTGTPMKSMSTRVWSKGTPHLPAAAATRPQLASWPKIAVLTSGELAIERATVSAASSSAAPRTFTVTSFVEPSPSAAILRASSPQTALSAAAKAA